MNNKRDTEERNTVTKMTEGSHSYVDPRMRGIMELTFYVSKFKKHRVPVAD